VSRPEGRFYREAEGRPHLIYEVCEYMRDDCRKCAAWVTTSRGMGQPGCYALAVELIAKVLEDEAVRAIELPPSLKGKQ